MFNIQPGQGLGFTGSKQIALGLGEGAIDVVVFSGGGGYVSGVTPRYRPTKGIDPSLAKRVRILQEDQEMLEFIQVLITSGIIE